MNLTARLLRSFLTALLAAPLAISAPVAAQSDLCAETDLNADGLVGGADLAILLNAWGACPGNACGADLNGDGVVNGVDLATLFVRWGLCPPTVSLTMPANGPVGGGTVLTIHGQAFYEVKSVTIGGVPATGV